MGEENNSAPSKSAVQIGADAARTVKHISKAASQAASQNYAGAAIELLKDENVRKGILAIILIPILLLVMFMYALPTTIWETTQTFFASLEEGFLADIYSGEYGNVTQSFFPALRNGASAFAQNVWSSFKGLFSGETDRNQTATEDIEAFTDAGHELLAAQAEESQKAALNAKIDATIGKFDARMEEIEEIVLDSGVIPSAVYGVWASEYGDRGDKYTYAPGTGPYAAETANGYTSKYYSYGDYTIEYRHEYGGCAVSSITSTPSKLACVKIMCTYTAMSGANISDMMISDYMKWLGYRPGYLFPGLGKNSYSVSQRGMTVSGIPRWDGTCLPQYLYEQKNYEEETYGTAILDYEEKYGCAVADILCTLNLPDVSGLSPTSIKETRSEEDPRIRWEWHPPTQTEIDAAEEAGEDPPDGYWERIYHKRFVVTYTYTYNASFSVGMRNADILPELLGVTGAEDGDGPTENNE